jgi:hypothetical protein
VEGARAESLRTLRLSASLILANVDDATRTIVGHIEGDSA